MSARFFLLSLGSGSGRINTETWEGCIVSVTTPTRSSPSLSRSVSSRSLAENAASVAVDEGAVDQNIDVVETVPQDGDPHCHVKTCESRDVEQIPQRVAQQRIEAELVGDDE